DLAARGGADTVTVNDQSTTGLDTFNINLRGGGTNPDLSGDNQADVIIINGTNGDDFGQISSNGVGVSALIHATVSQMPSVTISDAEGGLDVLKVNTLGGNDVLDASGLTSNHIQLTVNGGAGNDTLTGSAGDDTFVWNPGDGSDTIDGGDGLDTLTFNGSDA